MRFQQRLRARQHRATHVQLDRHVGHARHHELALHDFRSVAADHAVHRHAQVAGVVDQVVEVGGEPRVQLHLDGRLAPSQRHPHPVAGELAQQPQPPDRLAQRLADPAQVLARLLHPRKSHEPPGAQNSTYTP